MYVVHASSPDFVALLVVVVDVLHGVHGAMSPTNPLPKTQEPAPYGVAGRRWWRMHFTVCMGLCLQ